jgi:hypothetical protein
VPIRRSTISAELKFVVPTGEMPVNYPSEAGGRAEVDTGTADYRQVLIEDARQADGSFTLDANGFELRQQEPPIDDFYDDDAVAARYTPAVAALIGDVTGAREVRVFDHTRRSDDAELRARHGLRDPSPTVHNDYTPRSAAQRLEDFMGADVAARTRRFAIVNLWRSVAGTVLRAPLCLCDGASVDAQDLVVTERRARNRIGELYRIAFNPNQRWYFFPALAGDEVLLIKTFDSAPPSGVAFAPHASFRVPTAPDDAPPRQSIETRALVIY